MIDLKPLKIGWFLGWRQLKRSTIWSTALIIAIMALTFLNLVVVSGLLVGLIEGASRAVRENYIGDVIVSKLTENDFIENSQNIISAIENTPGVVAYSPRYLTSGTIEANYKERTDFNKNAEKVSTIIAGINPEKENALTGLSDSMVEGEFLDDDDFDQIVLGAYMLRKYLDLDSPTLLVLDDVEIGSKVRIQIGDNQREMWVKGIVKTKTDEVDRRIFMLDSQLKTMMGRGDLNVGEISIGVENDKDMIFVRNSLVNAGFDQFAKIQTFIEGQPKFLVDIRNTFNLLGIIISSIGLAVAAITVFIVIFINAITRRKYIGIMKAIGVNGVSIELAYVFQSLIYAIVGSVIGLLIVYFLLIPYFNANPINFPFSDGILVASVVGTSVRIAILISVTALAGYLPAKLIVRQNTLDSILGRE
jgi:ABC-type lipoprotein release transport system permease subunit